MVYDAQSFFPVISTMVIDSKIGQILSETTRIAYLYLYLSLASCVMLTHSYSPQYQRCQPQGAQSTAAPASSPDLQWCICEAEQGLHQHAQNRRALHCMGVSGSLK